LNKQNLSYKLVLEFTAFHHTLLNGKAIILASKVLIEALEISSKLLILYIKTGKGVYKAFDF